MLGSEEIPWKIFGSNVAGTWTSALAEPPRAETDERAVSRARADEPAPTLAAAARAPPSASLARTASESSRDRPGDPSAEDPSAAAARRRRARRPRRRKSTTGEFSAAPGATATAAVLAPGVSPAVLGGVSAPPRRSGAPARPRQSAARRFRAVDTWPCSAVPPASAAQRGPRARRARKRRRESVDGNGRAPEGGLVGDSRDGLAAGATGDAGAARRRNEDPSDGEDDEDEDGEREDGDDAFPEEDVSFLDFELVADRLALGADDDEDDPDQDEDEDEDAAEDDGSNTSAASNPPRPSAAPATPASAPSSSTLPPTPSSSSPSSLPAPLATNAADDAAPASGATVVAASDLHAPRIAADLPPPPPPPDAASHLLPGVDAGVTRAPSVLPGVPAPARSWASIVAPSAPSTSPASTLSATLSPSSSGVPTLPPAAPSTASRRRTSSFDSSPLLAGTSPGDAFLVELASLSTSELIGRVVQLRAENVRLRDRLRNVEAELEVSQLQLQRRAAKRASTGATPILTAASHPGQSLPALSLDDDGSQHVPKRSRSDP